MISLKMNMLSLPQYISAVVQMQPNWGSLFCLKPFRKLLLCVYKNSTFIKNTLLGKNTYIVFGVKTLCENVSALWRCVLSFQCTNGHLMCAGCFIHLLADARLKEEQATCPNCRCEISKSLCCRNLAVEKAVSELPSECSYCLKQFPRSSLERHQTEECQDRYCWPRISQIMYNIYVKPKGWIH